jgi:hypothetical protein
MKHIQDDHNTERPFITQSDDKTDGELLQGIKETIKQRAFSDREAAANMCEIKLYCGVARKLQKK